MAERNWENWREATASAGPPDPLLSGIFGNSPHLSRLLCRHPDLYSEFRQTGAGEPFEKLLDELRHKMALHYLNGKKVSVNETAYLVGFSEPAAFSRAFKRWTGTSPREVRMSR